MWTADRHRRRLARDCFDPLATPPKLFVDGPREVDPAHFPDRIDDVARALAVARTALKALDRYQDWQLEHWSYDTMISAGKPGQLDITFDPPNVTDSDVTIVIDLATDRIIAIQLGMA